MKVVIIIPALLAMLSLCARAPVVAQSKDQAQSNNLDREKVKGRPGNVYSVAWSYDGNTFASGNVDGTIKLWDTTTGQELRTLKGHSAPVGAVAWSSDGKKLASGGTDMTVKLWDAASGEELRTLEAQTTYIYSVAWSGDGRILAGATEDKNTIKFWDTTISPQ